MKTNKDLSIIQSVIHNAGLVLVNAPSVNHPIGVTLFYFNNPDGSVGWFWPKGNRTIAFSKWFSGGTLHAKWTLRLHQLLFALGLEGIFAHGRLMLYADLPTATYLARQWQRD